MIPLDDTWRAFDGVHGGAVVAWLLEEASTGTDHEPISISTHFLAPVQPELAKFEVAVEKSGRTTSSVRVQLEQGRVRAHAIVQRGMASPARLWDPQSDLGAITPPQSIERLGLPAEFVPFSRHIDVRPISKDVPGSAGPVPFYEAWIKMVDPAESDALSPFGRAAVLLDAMPPGLLATWRLPRPVPSVDMTIHFGPDAKAESDWFHIHHATTWSSDTWCVEDTTLRSESGGLVAQARQSRRVTGG